MSMVQVKLTAHCLSEVPPCLADVGFDLIQITRVLFVDVGQIHVTKLSMILI
jgi:hypothetical protein